MVDLIFRMERKYDLGKYPSEPSPGAGCKQRNYPERIAIMGAWKTGCLRRYKFGISEFN